MNQEQKNASKVGLVVAVSASALIVLFVVLMVIGSPTRTDPETTQKKQTTTHQIADGSEVIYDFDVPNLVGKNIDEVRIVLGAPEDEEPEPTQEQMNLGFDEWSNEFKKGETSLVVTYNPSTREIIDFFIPGEDKDKILQQGHLEENPYSYRIEEVKALRGGGITGIKITEP